MFFYFSSSFPIFKDIRHPELGPFFQGDIIGHPLDRNGIPNEIFRWQKGIYKFHVSDDYSFNEMMLIYQAILEVSTRTCLSVDELLETNCVERTETNTFLSTSTTCGRRKDIILP
ncbi:unnamed protein product [Allacma fusca]|uniref:Peptidase M12A domain-containing protein n=1 Tax=Allacma fusca TaxID=39272 RepID=A0A8J2L3I1_9HEXA|nr:unnamed protein product [Allacma fusca]